ncbi:hypothetical protein ACROYT_G030303 [Oculina patagonica]
MFAVWTESRCIAGTDGHRGEILIIVKHSSAQNGWTDPFKIPSFRSHSRNALHQLNALEIDLKKFNTQVADFGIGQSAGPAKE